MTNVLHLQTSRSDPVKRACASCAHVQNVGTAFQRCGGTGRYTHLERGNESYACGFSGKLWERKPARRGLLTWLRDAMFAGWKP